MSLFFTGLGLSGRISLPAIQGDSPLATVATLLVSLTLFVALPASAVGFGITVARDSHLPVVARVAPLASVVTSVFAALVFAAAPESREALVICVWTIFSAALWIVLGLVTRTRTGPAHRRCG